MSGSGDIYPVEEYAMIKTTKEDFKTFKEAFLRMAKKAGLTDWRLDIVHGDCGEAYSSVNSNIDARVVTVAFNVRWCDRSGLPKTKKAIIASAKHEVNELLVSEMADLAAKRFVNMSELERARHALVRTMDKFMDL
jgi:hypothetical protein